jgi:hypothetical protein
VHGKEGRGELLPHLSFFLSIRPGCDFLERRAIAKANAQRENRQLPTLLPDTNTSAKMLRQM